MPLAVAEVSHLSVPVDPESGLVSDQLAPASSQYDAGAVVSAGVVDAPKAVELRVGAVGVLASETE